MPDQRPAGLQPPACSAAGWPGEGGGVARCAMGVVVRPRRRGPGWRCMLGYVVLGERGLQWRPNCGFGCWQGGSRGAPRRCHSAASERYHTSVPSSALGPSEGNTIIFRDAHRQLSTPLLGLNMSLLVTSPLVFTCCTLTGSKTAALVTEPSHLYQKN